MHAATNSTEAMGDVANALRYMADASAATGHGPSTPERRKRAIEQLENDEDLSFDDIISFAEVIEARISVTDTFMGFKTKRLRTGYATNAITRYTL